MNKTDKSIKKLWDERSAKYKNNIAGVLPKSFPISANSYLDNWEFNLASEMVENKSGYKILDVGCGYGRLSGRILKKFGKVKTLGIDIAKNYVNLYNKNLEPRGRAYFGDMRKLPFKNNSMDLVIVVTSLMYMVGRNDQKKAFGEIFRVLKTNGKFLFVERDVWGYKLITLGGLIEKIRGKKNKEISAVGFSPQDITKLTSASGGVITKKAAIPFFTLSLPPILAFGKTSVSLLNWCLGVVAILDNLFSRVLFPSIYIAYMGHKK